jgi:hypothetical protein
VIANMEIFWATKIMWLGKIGMADTFALSLINEQYD